MQFHILNVKNVKKSFNGHDIIDDVNFELKKGEFVSLVGPSGCGKTVLLKILAGLMSHSGGEIRYDFTNENDINISMAFQRSPLFPWMDIFENITVCMNNRGFSQSEREKIAEDYLRKAQLERFKNYYPNQISGGMTQKVNVLRCFCSGSELILMDEPFVFLDFIQRTNLQKFTLDVWREERKTIFFVTHNLHEAITLSDRILLMSANPGKIINEFNVDFERPRNIEDIRESPKYIELFRDVNRHLIHEVEKFNEEAHN